MHDLKREEFGQIRPPAIIGANLLRSQNIKVTVHQFLLDVLLVE